MTDKLRIFMEGRQVAAVELLGDNRARWVAASAICCSRSDCVALRMFLEMLLRSTAAREADPDAALTDALRALVERGTPSRPLQGRFSFAGVKDLQNGRAVTQEPEVIAFEFEAGAVQLLAALAATLPAGEKCRALWDAIHALSTNVLLGTQHFGVVRSTILGLIPSAPELVRVELEALLRALLERETTACRDADVRNN